MKRKSRQPARGGWPVCASSALAGMKKRDELKFLLNELSPGGHGMDSVVDFASRGDGKTAPFSKWQKSRFSVASETGRSVKSPVKFFVNKF